MVDINRYTKNKEMLSDAEQEALRNSSVCVVGSGGLGGYSVEMLARIGVGSITIIDGDVFDVTNLNRQLISDLSTIGTNKALAAQNRIALVNPEVKIIARQCYLNEKNALDLLKNHDVIIDAIDTIEMRFLIQLTAKVLEIPYVFGAIAGWYGQVSTIFPGDDTLNKIYSDQSVQGQEKILGNPSFTPAIISGIQVSEAIKLLINRGDLLRHKLLFIDLLDQEYLVVDL